MGGATPSEPEGEDTVYNTNFLLVFCFNAFNRLGIGYMIP